MRTLGVIAASVAAFLALAWFGLNLLAWGRLTGAPTQKNFEAIAREGQPIAQAVSDYQSDHGVLPISWEDIVPAYLPTKPKEWSYADGLLDHFSGLPHTRVAFSFDETGGGRWELMGEYAAGRIINIPGPVVKKVSLSADVIFANQLAQLEKRIATQPREVFYYREKIAFTALSKSNDMAIAECHRAAGLFPKWWFPPMALAVLLTNEVPAEQNFKSWVEAHPTFINYWYLSRFYREKGNYDASFAALEKAAESSFTSYAKEIEKSQRQLQLTVQLAAAGKSLPSADDESDDDLWSPDFFAQDAVRFCCEQRKYQLALKILQHCGMKDSPFKPIAELGLGQFDTAIADARSVPKISMDFVMQLPHFLELAHEQKTNLYFVEQDDESAKWVLFSMPGEIASDDNNIDFVLQHADQNEEKGDFDAAIANCTRAIQLEPLNEIAYNLRAWEEFLKNDFDGAMNDSARAIQLNLNFGNAYGTRGWARYGKGDTNGALEDLKAAIALCGEDPPNAPESVEDNGLIEFINGNNQKAIDFWQKVIQMDSSRQRELQPWIEKARQHTN